MASVSPSPACVAEAFLDRTDTSQSNGNVVVYWPLPASGFVLDWSATLANVPASWLEVGFHYQTNTTHIFINVPLTIGSRFYRLRKQ